jgi:hypothetical protein
MVTQGVHIKGVLSWLNLWACRAGTGDFCSACLGCSSLPSTKNFFLTIHYFNAFVPIAQQAGQAAVLGRLSLFVSLSTT